MTFQGLLELLLDFSEKAATIARLIRRDESLFNLLIEEKTGNQKNERFAHDFKTLTDVLIQQALAKDIEMRMAPLAGRVYGEESPSFSNALGETITVTVQETKEKTAKLLQKVLDNNIKAAGVLSSQLHTDIKSAEKITQPLSNICLDNLAIWIDPIDSTAEYINGVDFPFDEAYPNLGEKDVVAGLCCVTVLVGIFDVKSGCPVAGVVHQPFATGTRTSDSKEENYTGKLIYGAVEDKLTNVKSPKESIDVLSKVSISASENSEVVKKLKSGGIEVIAASGCGFKSLIVATGHVQAYVCTKGSTYMWDTCAPHAILLSMGGGMVPASCLSHFLSVDVTNHLEYQVKYSPGGGGDISSYCNTQGVVAYRHPSYLNTLAKLLA